MFKSKSSLLVYVVTLVILVFSCNAFSEEINTSLVVSEPAGAYYAPGETITATLWMWDNNGDTLYADEASENGLVNLVIWFAGPNYDYRTVEDYDNIDVIQWSNTFNPSSGFNPENGEIEFVLPNNINESGTYTILAKCMRRVGNDYYSDYPRVDITIGQVRSTSNQGMRFLSCNSCHSMPMEHGTNDLADCLVCHNQSHTWSFVSMMHNLHDEEGIDNCMSCHLAGGGVNNYGAMACYTCHSMPGGHSSYSDNMCSGCHTGGNSVYSNHDVPSPNRPGAFTLSSPEDGAAVTSETVILEWQVATDSDASDQVLYEVEIASSSDFADVKVYSVGRNTSYELMDLYENTEYWWRILALDRNTEGRYSSDMFSFNTSSSGVENSTTDIPDQAKLSRVYPNPFNASLNVEIEVPSNLPLTLKMYNTNGQVMLTSSFGEMRQGRWNSSYDLSDFSSGIYFIQLSSSSTRLDMKKVILIK